MHTAPLPTLSNVPSLSGSSGTSSIPPSELCTPNGDDVDFVASQGFFSKALSASVEDLFATPRPRHGLADALDDEDKTISIAADKPRRRRWSDHMDSGLQIPSGPPSPRLPPAHKEIEITSELPLSGLGISTSSLMPTTSEPWSHRRVLSVAVKVLFFLPWCVAVGGTILLSPYYLDHVAFKTGYVSHERGPHRFGYWAQCAHQHVVIFLAFLAACGWWNLRYGTWAVAAVLAGTVYAWHDFKVDFTVPLGEDERQSLYLALTKVYLQDDFVMHVPTKSTHRLDT